MTRLICFAICGLLVALNFTPWAQGSEWAEVLPAAALLTAVLGIAIPYLSQKEQEAKAKGVDLVRLPVGDLPSFLESDERPDVFVLTGYHSNQKQGQAFGFVPHAVYGDLYLTPGRIVYVLPGDPEPALNVPLERVVRVSRHRFSLRPLRLDVVDETGGQTTWHFGKEGGQAEEGIKLLTWIETARDLVERAKRNGPRFTGSARPARG